MEKAFCSSHVPAPRRASLIVYNIQGCKPFISLLYEPSVPATLLFHRAATRQRDLSDPCGSTDVPILGVE